MFVVDEAPSALQLLCLDKLRNDGLDLLSGTQIFVFKKIVCLPTLSVVTISNLKCSFVFVRASCQNIYEYHSDGVGVTFVNKNVQSENNQCLSVGETKFYLKERTFLFN